MDCDKIIAELVATGVDDSKLVEKSWKVLSASEDCAWLAAELEIASGESMKLVASKTDVEAVSDESGVAEIVMNRLGILSID